MWAASFHGLGLSKKEKMSWDRYSTFSTLCEYHVISCFKLLLLLLTAMSWLSFSINLTFLCRGILTWGIDSMTVCGHDSGSIFLIASWCRWVQSTVGGIISMQVDLGWKWSASKLRFSKVSALVPASVFLSSVNLSGEDLFPFPNCFSSECFLSACVAHSLPVACSPAYSISGSRHSIHWSNCEFLFIA